MKSPEQILDFILSNQSDKMKCLYELEIQLRMYELRSIASPDKSLAGRYQRSSNIDTDYPIRTIHHKQSDRVIEIASEGTNEC